MLIHDICMCNVYIICIYLCNQCVGDIIKIKASFERSATISKPPMFVFVSRVCVVTVRDFPQQNFV